MNNKQPGETRVDVRMSPELKAELVRLAGLERRSLNNFIVTVLTERAGRKP